MTQTFRGQPIVSDQVSRFQIAVLWRELERVLDLKVPGDIVEFGCYVGTSALFLRRLLDEKGQSDNRSLHVYDSFAGLPPKAPQDSSTVGEAFVAGELTATRKQLLHHFKQANLQVPIIHKGWFADLTDTNVPANIGFAFLDGDFYDSIRDSLRLVWPRMKRGGCVVIDDYAREALPGVERAVHDYFAGKVTPAIRREHGFGIIHV